MQPPGSPSPKGIPIISSETGFLPLPQVLTPARSSTHPSIPKAIQGGSWLFCSLNGLSLPTCCCPAPFTLFCTLSQRGQKPAHALPCQSLSGTSCRRGKSHSLNWHSRPHIWPWLPAPASSPIPPLSPDPQSTLPAPHCLHYPPPASTCLASRTPIDPSKPS